MCRLFGMSGGREPVQATFWLFEAPDSLAQQSRREPDGTGLGTTERMDEDSGWRALDSGQLISIRVPPHRRHLPDRARGYATIEGSR